MVSFSTFETISRKLDFERYLVNGIKSFTITDAAANKLERLASIVFFSKPMTTKVEHLMVREIR